MNDKLKNIIFEKLTEDLSTVDMIMYDKSIWFIDKEKKYWYLELTNTGKLYWRWGFFSSFFQLFSMEQIEFEPLITEWMVLSINGGVSKTALLCDGKIKKINEVLNNIN